MSSRLRTRTTHSHRPPILQDEGWAWMVMLGAFFNTTFTFCFIRALSILFIEFLDKFQQSATMTTLAFGLQTAAFSLASILVPPLLLPRFSVRNIAIVGAAVNALSIIGMAFSPDIICINLMFVTQGLSHPLIFISQVSLLAVYFKKRLSFAVAFANLGLSIGFLCGPLLTQYLLDTYGLFGALLIHGGLNLHNIAACFLFRPPSSYNDSSNVSVENHSEINLVNDQSQLQKFNEKDTQTAENNENNFTDIIVTVTEDKFLIDEMNTKTNCSIYPRSFTLRQHEIPRTKSLKSVNDVVGTNHKPSMFAGSERNISSRSKFSSTEFFTVNSNWNVIDRISSSKSITYLRNASLYVSQTIARPWRESERVNMDKEDTTGSELLTGDEIDQDKHLLEIKLSGQGCEECEGSQSSSSSDSSDEKSVYCHPLGIFLMFVAGIGVNTQCTAAYMPSLGKEQGLTTHQLPVLMMTIGLCDFCKIGIGLLADQGWVKRIYIVLVCQVVIGISFQFTILFQGFGPMIGLCVIFGANTGVLHVLLPGMTIDLIGAEFIGHVMSGYFIINGVVMSLTHVLMGLFKDETGSFTAGYNFIGGLILFSAVLIVLESVIVFFIEKYTKPQKALNSKECCQCVVKTTDKVNT